MTAGKALATGLFQSRTATTRAVDLLVERGLAAEQDISLLMSDHTRASQFAVEEKSKALEGAAVGGAAGGALGAVTAALIAAGVISFPPVGLVAAGPMLAALAGAGAGGATGGLVGAVMGSGVPELEAELVAERLEAGRILLGVLVDPSQVETAKRIMRDAGGEVAG